MKSKQSNKKNSERNPSIIMILLDGARIDRIKLSKELSEITKKGVFFSNMVASGPYTLISLYSIFSGMYGSKNGIDSYFGMFRFRKEKCKTLMMYLKEKGYFIRADLVNDALIKKEDFDKVTTHNEFEDNLLKKHSDVIKEVSQLNKEGKNFFLFMQYSNIHTNIVRNVIKVYDDFSDDYFKKRKENIERYNGYLMTAGKYAKSISELIEKENLSKNTIVIFFSDHGISNGERIGEKAYGSYLYDYTIRNFSVFINKKLFEENKEIRNLARSIDIMPTLMELLGIKEDKKYENMQGKSLIPVINGKEKNERIAFAETGGLNGPYPSPKAPNVKCVRTNKWKLVHNLTPDTYELYDLEKDPEEKKNLIGNNLAIKKTLKKELKKIVEDCII